MSIDPIQGLSATSISPAIAQTPAAMATGPQAFGNWFTSEVARVNHQIARVDTDTQALASGQAISLHQVMIDLEEAKLSFDLLAQVRNRLLESYQEVMRTQV